MSALARGTRFQTVVLTAIGVALLSAAVAAIFASSRNDLLDSYNSAPTCAGLSDAVVGKDCRYTTTATVNGIFGDPGGVWVDFDIPGTYTPFSSAMLPNREPPSSLSVGSQVQVEIWRLRVTRIADATTAANPVNDTRPGDLLEIGLLLIPLSLAALVWAALIIQRGRGAEGEPTMSPVAISDALWH